MFDASKFSHKISFKLFLFEFCGETFEVASLFKKNKKTNQREQVHKKNVFVKFFCV